MVASSPTMAEGTEMNLIYIKQHIKCDCGHYAKDHYLNEGQCKKCACTWYWPNDKHLQRILQAEPDREGE
jgi:Zn finger protein HypA/HybF involved in hydrogenase expression